MKYLYLSTVLSALGSVSYAASTSRGPVTIPLTARRVPLGAGLRRFGKRAVSSEGAYYFEQEVRIEMIASASGLIVC